MATYTADRATPGVEAITNAAADTTVVAVFALTAALATNDIIQMMSVPSGAYICDVILATDALDTNAASTISYDVGDSNAAQRYIAAKAQGNNVALPPYHMDQKNGLGYKTGANSGDTLIEVKVHAGPATGATSGQVVLAVRYSMAARTPSS